MGGYLKKMKEEKATSVVQKDYFLRPKKGEAGEERDVMRVGE